MPLSRTSLALACIGAWVAAAASTRSVGIWLGLGGAAIALGIAVFFLDPAATRELLRPSPRQVFIGTIVGGLMAAVAYLLYPRLVLLAPFTAGETALLYAAFRAPSLAVASLALAPVILGEELVWRGVVQGAFVRRLGPSAGVTLAAFAYAFAHLPVGSPVLIITSLACGLSWGALRSLTRTLVPTVVAHLVWDVIVLLWLPLEAG